MYFRGGHRAEGIEENLGNIISVKICEKNIVLDVLVVYNSLPYFYNNTSSNNKMFRNLGSKNTALGKNTTL